LKKENKTVNQWMALNHVLFIYKAIGLGLVGLVLVLGVLCFYVSDRTPLVVKEQCGETQHLVGARKDVPINEEHIKSFVKSYVRLRYIWEEVNLKKTLLDIRPFVTSGFSKKTGLELKNFMSDEFKDKKLSQKISGIDVMVTDKSTIATFDRILRVNGIPLIIPTQMSFALVKGERSYWNTLGLLINGVTIHEGH
jgi:hypothetical protein